MLTPKLFVIIFKIPNPRKMNSPQQDQDKIQELERIIQLSEKRIEKVLAEKKRLDDCYQRLLGKRKEEKRQFHLLSERQKSLESEISCFKDEIIREKEEGKRAKSAQFCDFAFIIYSSVIIGICIFCYIVMLIKRNSTSKQ